MKLYQIYFSPTGGTKKVIQIIGNAWDCEKIEIDLLNPKNDMLKYSFAPEDLCIIAVPSFSGRVPKPALEQLKKLHGNQAKTILAAVYGNRDFDDTLIELKDTLDYADFSSTAAIAAVAEHSIVHQYGNGRPDDQDKEELKQFSNQIKETLKNMDTKKSLKIPGNHPYREYQPIPLKPTGNKNCNKCGKCVKECPVQAIPKENPSSVIKNKCISCMHCISVCPQKARYNHKLLLFIASKKLKKSCHDRKENKLFL